MRYSGYCILSMVVFISACAQTPSSVWTSMPPVQNISTPTYTIEVRPLKRDGPYYVAFLLSIHNRSNQPLELDWNQTRYLHKEEDLGVFVFKGIDPESIQKVIPSDRIPAGTTFSKEIFPLRTISFLSGDRTLEPGQRRFEPGILPAGDNSIALVLRQNGNRWKEILTLRLIAEPGQP